mmetsp:Transcript_9592/g.9374  ORF Transcript_9592/g.9374 Transcript_9592/m.9374 type:complete len:167 (+) Transcript_9592:144-644(+)
MGLVLLAQPLYLVAITMTKISILGVLGPIGILASIILARVFLEEKISTVEYLAMILFIPGSIITLCFSSLENHRYNKEEFDTLFYSCRSLTYLFINCILMCVLLPVCHYILKMNPYDKKVTYHEQLDEPLQDYSTRTPSSNSKDSFKTSSFGSVNLHNIFSEENEK